MKQIMNITTMQYELDRYKDRADFQSYIRGLGLDGVELMEAGEDTRRIIAAEDVIGVHLRNVPCWYCLWSGDEKSTMEEFGDWEEVKRQFGGTGREALLQIYRDSLSFARRYHPQYVVFHVSDNLLAEAATREFRYTDEEIADAAAEILNQIFTRDEGFELLLENLWWPGLTMTRPQIVYRLLEKVRYPRTGFMLDLGHLLHTNPALRTIEEACVYLGSVLDRYDDKSIFRGVHIHQTLNGAYVEEQRKHPPVMRGTYLDKMETLTRYVYQVDSHRPLPREAARGILDMLQPEYLVYELLAFSREEHTRWIRECRN